MLIPIVYDALLIIVKPTFSIIISTKTIKFIIDLKIMKRIGQKISAILSEISVINNKGFQLIW
jgi:hypothetical protein